MTVVLPEAVSGEIARFGYIEEELSSAFIKFIKPGATVLDVGSHFGFFSLLACHLVGDKGTVHAFEPVPSTHNILSHNLQHCPALTCNVAVWCEPTEIKISDQGLGMSAFNSIRAPRLIPGAKENPRPSINVPAITL